MNHYIKQSILVMLLTLLGMQAMAIEEAKYTVLKQEGQLELRQYEPHIVAETLVESDFEGAGNKAFRRLFNYISGNNESRQEIAMTAPVSQAEKGEKIAMTVPVGQQLSGKNWVISFMMPASYTLETLPKPKDNQVILRQVPEHYVAAIRYSGFWSQKSYNHHKQQLEAWIKKQSFKTTGEAIWARYNAPFTPWFFRRNEILVPVEQ